MPAVQFISGTISTSGLNVIVPAVMGQRVYVFAYYMSLKSSVTAQLVDSTGNTFGYISHQRFPEDHNVLGMKATPVSTGLALNLSSAVPVTGWILYAQGP